MGWPGVHRGTSSLCRLPCIMPPDDATTFTRTLSVKTFTQCRGCTAIARERHWATYPQATRRS
eukprot:3533563-Pyramimonas_sp.AAC.1